MKSTALCAALLASLAHAQASAVAETTPIASGPTSANDTAVWLHPTLLSKSLVFGTDQLGGALISYALDGTPHQSLNLGLTLAVDVKYGVNVAGVERDVVLAVSTDGAYRLFTPDRDGGMLTPIDNGATLTGNNASAAALYNTPGAGTVAVFVADTVGNLRHYKVASSNGKLVSMLTRTVPLPGRVEGIASDDVGQELYLTIANKGLYRLQAEEDGILTPTLIESVDAGRLEGAAGVAAYFTGDGGGVVVVSASATSTYSVYSLANDKFVASFRLVPDAGRKGATGSRGIEVVPLDLGAPFSKGLFVAHDPNNATGPNYKLAAWDEIAGATTPALPVDLRLDPRTWKLLDAGKPPPKDAGPELPICPAPPDAGPSDGGDAGDPDAGPAVDAGPCRPGTGGGAGGGGGTAGVGGGVGGSAVGGGNGLEEPKGCSCNAGGFLLPLAALAWLLGRRRRAA